MRSLYTLVVSAVILIPMLSGLVSAQEAAEMQKLRKFLKVPSTAKIEPVTAGFPSRGPLKVYIATDSEPSTRAQVMELVDKVNDKAVAPNRVEVVAAAAQADVVLVQFENAEKRRMEQSTALATSTRAGSGMGTPTLRSEALGWVLVRTQGGYGVIEQFKKSIEIGQKRRELKGAFERALKKSGRMN
jgi:hypothetical protein